MKCISIELPVTAKTTWTGYTLPASSHMYARNEECFFLGITFLCVLFHLFFVKKKNTAATAKIFTGCGWYRPATWIKFSSCFIFVLFACLFTWCNSVASERLRPRISSSCQSTFLSTPFYIQIIFTQISQDLSAFST